MFIEDNISNYMVLGLMSILLFGLCSALSVEAPIKDSNNQNKSINKNET